MGFHGLSIRLSLLFGGIAFCSSAQQQNLTDAPRVDFIGPVKYVSTQVTAATDVVWSEPGGPTLVLPNWCQECEFDTNRNRTKFGQIIDGRFQGETVHLLFDGQGRVTERIAQDVSTGQTIRREIVGTFGNTEESFYRDGELQSRTLFSYDQYGHRIDELGLDGFGKQQFHSVVNTDKNGNDTERWDWGKEGELRLHFRQTFDPKTNVEQFTSFDPSGGMKLAWTVIGGKLSSYWQMAASSSEFGDGFSEDIGNDTFATYQCHSDGSCERARVHYVYLDAKRRNPQSVSNGETSRESSSTRRITSTKSTPIATGRTE
jgi:hypothetical protein